MKSGTIKKVLLCEPNHFRVSYQINPWMTSGAVNSSRALKQWRSLAKEFEGLGVEVEIIKQDSKLPDMVFSTDQAVIIEQDALMSNFKHKERQPESKRYEEWLRKKKYRIFHLPKDVNFEGGGDSLFYDRSIFVGVGIRSSRKACTYIANHTKRSVVPLSLINPLFFHLDTALFPLNDEIAFYYPNAFSITSQNMLKMKVKKLLPFSKKEAENFAANSFVIGKTVLTQKGNSQFIKKVKSFGYIVRELEMGEFMKAGGGIHCLVLMLG